MYYYLPTCYGSSATIISVSHKKTKNTQHLHKLHNQNQPLLQYSSTHGCGTYKVKKKLCLQEGYFKDNEHNNILCGNHVSSDGRHFSKFRLILWLQAAWSEVDSRLPCIFLPPYPVLLAHPPFCQEGSRTLSLAINCPGLKVKSGVKNKWICGVTVAYSVFLAL